MAETFETEQAEILKGFCESYALMKVLGGDAAAKPPLEHLVSYVGGLLATKDAEIARLEARQITPEMQQSFRRITKEKDRNFYLSLFLGRFEKWIDSLEAMEDDAP